MINFLNNLNLKQMLFRTWRLALFVFLLFQSEKSFAQLSRIAVVNLADSSLVYKHIGFPGFKDNTDTFNCSFNCIEYLDKEITRLLSIRYSVTLITIPPSLLASNGSIYASLDIKKEVTSWIAGFKDQYDYIVFIETGEKDDLLDSKKQKLHGSGLYSRGNPPNSWVAVFSTIRFSLVRTSDAKNLDYESSGMDYIFPIKEYQFSRDDVLIDPEMLPVIKAELSKLLDYKMEYFLTNSFLM
jgi:hypothetical protein